MTIAASFSGSKAFHAPTLARLNEPPLLIGVMGFDESAEYSAPVKLQQRQHAMLAQRRFQL